MEKKYSRQEVEEILRRALTEREDDSIAHDDLLTAAAEVGIDSRTLEKAAGELRQGRAELTLRDGVLQQSKSSFFRHLRTYLVINAGLLAIDIATGPGFWFQFGAIAWGVPLVLQGLRSYFPNEAAVKQAMLKTQRKADKEARKTARAKRPPLTDSQREQRSRNREATFERLIDNGIDALLDKASEQLDKHLGQAKPTGQPPGVGQPPQPKIRVADPDAYDEAPPRPARRGRRKP